MLSLEIITSYNFVIKDKKNEVILESTPFSSFMGCKQSADFQFKELSDEYSVFDEYLYDDNWSELQPVSFGFLLYLNYRYLEYMNNSYNFLEFFFI